MKGYNNKNQDPFRERVANLRYAVSRGLRRISQADNCTAVESASRDARKVICEFKRDPFYRFIRKTPRYERVADNLSEQVEMYDKSRKKMLLSRLRNGEW